MHFLRYYLWIAPNVLLGLFLFVFFCRRLQYQLSSLVIYVIVSLVQFLAEVSCGFHSPFPYRAYGWILAFGNGLTAILAIWILYKLASKLLFPTSSFAALGRWFFVVSLVVLIFIAATVSGGLSDFSIYRAFNLFGVLNFSSALIKAGLLLVLLVFSRALNLSWTNWLVGITLGFGVDACFDLSSAAWRAVYGRAALISVDIAQGIGFHLCVVIWLIYLLLPDRPAQFPGNGLRTDDLEVWNEQLQNIIR